MKRLALLLVFLGVYASLFSQEQKGNHYILSAGYNTTVPYGNDGLDGGVRSEDFRGFDVMGEYKMYLYKGLFLSPGVSLYYQQHRVLGRTPLIPESAPDDNYSYAMGVGLSASVGYNIPMNDDFSWDFYTGAAFRHSFVVKRNLFGARNDNTGDWQYCKWSALRLPLGAGINFKRVSLRVEYAFTLTPYRRDWVRGGFDSAETDLLSVRIGYKF